MLTYRNKKTGAVVTVPCPVSGDWELVEEPGLPKKSESEEAKSTGKPPVKKSSRYAKKKD